MSSPRGSLKEEESSDERTPLMDPVATVGYTECGDEKAPQPIELPFFDSDQPMSGDFFGLIINEVKFAISKGVHPTMITQGSSGSYFCRDRHGKIVGVFKPKNEEPYGQLNPKWAKWLQRTCCPCCFGRGCLIPNCGYTSEASASLVDQLLGLEVVPRTEIVSLASPVFSYAYFDRRKKVLPGKLGSFQIFVRGYKDASICFKELQSDPFTDELKTQFRLQFERLVILDYLIRNTDRGNDNWMIKIDLPKEPEATEGSEGEWEQVSPPFLKIAAIDNGLAFPFKHPDSWRAYPFGWASLPCARVPFSDETKERFLPKLIDPDWCDQLLHELKNIAQVDADYNEKQFQKQLGVIRGQIWNLVEALMKQYTPLELVSSTPLTIHHVATTSGFRRRLMSISIAAPFFSTW